MLRRRLVRQIAAVVRKEFREYLRVQKISFGLTVGYSVFMQWFIVHSYAHAVKMAASLPESKAASMLADPEVFAAATAGTLMFIGPLVLPFFANSLLARSFMEERYKHVLAPMFSTGVNPGVVWLGKLIAAFTASYATMTLCVGLDLGLLTMYFGLSIALTPGLVLMALFVMPTACLGMVALIAYLNWAWQQATFVISFAMFLLMMGVFSFLSARPVLTIGPGFATILVVLSLLLVGACAFGVSLLSRQRIVNV